MRRSPAAALTAALLAVSGLLAQPAAAATVTVLGTSEPQASTWALDDHKPLELGLRLTTSQDGYVTAIRFFKNASDKGTHTGHVWDAAGTMLGSVSFTGESASGWQTQKLATPVFIKAGATFTVSVLFPSEAWYPRESFVSKTSGPFSGLEGTYAYTGTAAFPGSAVGGRNYFVDLEFGSGASYSSPGYLTPVRSTDYNDAKSGSAVPLKFQVFDGDTEVTDPAQLTFVVESTDCDADTGGTPVAPTSSGRSSLRYDASDHQFVQNWKVPKSPGMCYLVHHEVDGQVVASALFRTT